MLFVLKGLLNPLWEGGGLKGAQVVLGAPPMAAKLGSCLRAAHPPE